MRQLSRQRKIEIRDGVTEFLIYAFLAFLIALSREIALILWFKPHGQ
jgi:hypothetical protein